MTDNQIIEGIKRGDEKCLVYMYQKHYRMMANLVQKNNGTPDEAQDVFQEALIVFWQKVTSNQLVLTAKISTYLYSICLNLWRKELDKKKRLSHEEKDSSIEMDFETEEKNKLIHQCLSQLGDACKKILMLYYFDDLSMDEIAKAMGFANADTAKTKKYKCKKELDILVNTKVGKAAFEN